MSAEGGTQNAQCGASRSAKVFPNTSDYRSFTAVGWHVTQSVTVCFVNSDSAYSSKRSSAHATGGPPAEIPQAWEPEKRGQEVVEVEEENTDE